MPCANGDMLFHRLSAVSARDVKLGWLIQHAASHVSALAHDRGQGFVRQCVDRARETCGLYALDPRRKQIDRQLKMREAMRT